MGEVANVTPIYFATGGGGRGVGGRGGLCNSGQASFSSVGKTSRGRASGDTLCPLGRGVPSCLSLACPRGLVCFNYHGRHAF